MLPKNHILRKTYASEFSKDTVLSSYGPLRMPAKRTRKEAIESATRVLKKPKNKAVAKEESFHSISSFTKRLPYHDVTKHCMTDIAHTIANMVKLLLGTVTNLNAKAGSSSRFSKKHRTFEVDDLKRFAYLKKTKGKKRYARVSVVNNSVSNALCWYVLHTIVVSALIFCRF